MVVKSTNSLDQIFDLILVDIDEPKGVAADWKWGDEFSEFCIGSPCVTLLSTACNVFGIGSSSDSDDESDDDDCDTESGLCNEAAALPDLLNLCRFAGMWSSSHDDSCVITPSVTLLIISACSTSLSFGSGCGSGVGSFDTDLRNRGGAFRFRDDSLRFGGILECNQNIFLQ